MNWLVAVWMTVATFVRATRSPLIKAPAYRALLLLVVAGVLLICTLPEAAFVLPAFDALGLDIVTILVALELRHYILFPARLVGVPLNGFRYGLAQLVSRCLPVVIIPTNPSMWPYAYCLWVFVAVRIFMGSTEVPPQAQG